MKKSTTQDRYPTYWEVIWMSFKKNPIGMSALYVLLLFVLIGLYAPLLASSKPLVIIYDGKLFFPLFRYLFFTGFYTKRVDIFYNLLMFTLPIGILGVFLLSKFKNKWVKPFIISLVF